MRWHRRVYFIGGFDARSPRHYHRLMRVAAAQRPADGAQATVGARTSASALEDSWPMSWTDADGRSWATRYAVLRWDDLARARSPAGLTGLLRSAARVYGRALPDGPYMRTLWRHARSGLLMGLVPLALLGVCLLAGGAAGLVAAALGAPTAAAAGLALAAALVLLAATAKPSRAAWMLGLLDLTDALARGQDAALNARLDAMARALVAAAVAADADELLLVGHSVGSNWATAVLARAQRLAPWLGTRGPAVGLVTLGQTLPLGTARTAGANGRADVATLTAMHGLTWLDVSAPADWAALAGLPPWGAAPAGAAGVAQCQARSPRFHAALAPARYAALKRDRHALHMQYLRAPDLPGSWDIVAQVAGPKPLATF